MKFDEYLVFPKKCVDSFQFQSQEQETSWEKEIFLFHFLPIFVNFSTVLIIKSSVESAGLNIANFKLLLASHAYLQGKIYTIHAQATQAWMKSILLLLFFKCMFIK